MKENIKEKSLLVEFINKFYILVKINILSAVLLILGLGFITFPAVIKSILFEVDEIEKGNIDVYSSLRKSYMNVFIREMRNYKKNAVLSLSFLWLICISIITRNINSIIAAIINIIIIYTLLMIVIYSSYSEMLDIRLENLKLQHASRLKRLSFQFFKIDKLIYSLILLGIILILSIRLPILVFVLSVSIYGYGFYKINLNNSENFISIIWLKGKK